MLCMSLFVRHSCRCCLLLILALSARAQTATPPDLTIAANNGPGGPNYAGWPLLLTGTIALTGDSTFLLRPAQISVSIYSAAGEKLDITASAIAVPNADVTLDENNDIVTLRYALSPEQSAALSGDFTFELAVGDLKARSTIAIKAPPAPLPAELDTKRRFAFADYHLATGNPQAALDLMNEELSVAPKFVPAMSRAASALQQLNRRDEALQLLSDAIDAVKQQNPDSTHPPRELIRRYRELLLAVTGGAGQ